MVAVTGYTKFKNGQRVVICLKDGRRVTGQYLGVAHGTVGIYTEIDGREGTVLMPKKAIAFMRADGPA